MGLRRIDGYTANFDPKEYRRKERNRQIRKLLIALIEVAVFIAAFAGLIMLLESISLAEEYDDEYYEMYVICQPGDYVNVRYKPSAKSMIVGYCDPGDEIRTDGTIRKGFMRIYGIGDSGEGWIHAGYLTDSEPERIRRTATVVSNRRLAARKCIGGKVRKWLKNGDEITVYWYSDEWCVTNKGFVMTEYIELDGDNS